MSVRESTMDELWATTAASTAEEEEEEQEEVAEAPEPRYSRLIHTLGPRYQALRHTPSTTASHSLLAFTPICLFSSPRPFPLFYLPLLYRRAFTVASPPRARRVSRPPSRRPRSTCSPRLRLLRAAARSTRQNASDRARTKSRSNGRERTRVAKWRVPAFFAAKLRFLRGGRRLLWSLVETGVPQVWVWTSPTFSSKMAFGLSL